ncbi:MAG TPA: response regulator [Gemmatimonadales bacterium]|jgi:DNA-binding response OmpR family regulator|nr:response regulator [Gemmatimonadales bacterium]
MPAPGRSRFLIVEDEPDVRRVVARFVRLLGADPIVAEDGEEGWELARLADPPFDLVVTDSRMPRMTGRVLISKLREMNPELPILRVSGSDGLTGEPPMPEIVTLRKPFTLDEFVAAVQEALSRGKA